MSHHANNRLAIKNNNKISAWGTPKGGTEDVVVLTDVVVLSAVVADASTMVVCQGRLGCSQSVTDVSQLGSTHELTIDDVSSISNANWNNKTKCVQVTNTA
jgi:hypothetical protein